MTTYIIVSQGQLIDTQIKRTIDGFIQKISEIERQKGIEIADSQTLEQTGDLLSLKLNIQQRFLKELVARFRVNGFFSAAVLSPTDPPRTPGQVLEAVTQENERIFREETRRLLGITTNDLSDEVFDEIWCRMCTVEEGHAQRYRELLAHPHVIFHSGTNSIQARYIASRLQSFGVIVPPERLFLSYEHGCEYTRTADQESLIHKIFRGIQLKPQDKILLLQGSKDATPFPFSAVAKEWYQDTAITATELHENTQVVDWNNNAQDDSGVPISLLTYLNRNQLIPQTAIAFFMSSVGDADLAIGTLEKLLEQQSLDKAVLFPLTEIATRRIEHLVDSRIVRVINLPKAHELIPILQQHGVQQAYVGVPSDDSHKPFEIADCLTDHSIPCVLAYEYMFRPSQHVIYDYLPRLAKKSNCRVAVPLPIVVDHLHSHASIEAFPVGHLSIDQALTTSPVDPAPIRSALSIAAEQKFVFISGSSQPVEIDARFLEALLVELATGQYPKLQLRMGIHPGVKELKFYLNTLLSICTRYSNTALQFKIIITPEIAQKLNNEIPSSDFIIKANINGNQAAQGADAIAQSVPGALLNMAAMQGKPAYFHEKSTQPYLPIVWFSGTLSHFFSAAKQAPHTKTELGLSEKSATALLAKQFKL